jgi:hypothetical protein
MGVDVHHIKPIKQNEKDFLMTAKGFLRESSGLIESIELSLGKREWLMQFSTSYMCWLHWIITASGDDPSRVGMVSPMTNTKFLVLHHGHPWDRNGIYIRDEDCADLIKDLEWFITKKMPGIKHCDYLKTKTKLFFKAVQTVAEAGGVLYIG